MKKRGRLSPLAKVHLEMSKLIMAYAVLIEIEKFRKKGSITDEQMRRCIKEIKEAIKYGR